MTQMKLTLIRKNPLVLPVILAYEQGLFNKRGIEMSLVLEDDFSFNGNHPFYEGHSDAMMGDITFFFYMLKRGKEAVMTSNLTRTIQLVGGPKCPDDWQNLRIGANRAGLLRLYLENDLKQKISHPEIKWFNNSYERLKALEVGEIDALVAIDPFAADVVEKGGKVIWHSKNSDKNLVMWAFDKTYYEKNKEVVYAFHMALEEAAMRFNQLMPGEKKQIGIRYGNYPEKIARRLEGFYFEKQGNIRKEDFELCQKWMLKEKEIHRLYDEKIYRATLFQEVKNL